MIVTARGSPRGSVNVRMGRLASLAMTMRRRSRRGAAASRRMRSSSGTDRRASAMRAARYATGERWRPETAPVSASDRAPRLVAHAAHAAEDAARLDANALGVDVALDASLREDLEVTRAGHVAHDLPGDDDVRAA